VRVHFFGGRRPGTRARNTGSASSLGRIDMSRTPVYAAALAVCLSTASAFTLGVWPVQPLRGLGVHGGGTARCVPSRPSLAHREQHCGALAELSMSGAIPPSVPSRYKSLCALNTSPPRNRCNYPTLSSPPFQVDAILSGAASAIRAIAPLPAIPRSSFRRGCSLASMMQGRYKSSALHKYPDQGPHMVRVLFSKQAQCLFFCQR